MSDNLVITYRLLPTTPRAQYEKWLLKSDAPFVQGRRTVMAYTCQRVEMPAASSTPPPFDYIETLKVTDLREDEALLQCERGQTLTRQWMEMTASRLILPTAMVTRYVRDGQSGD